MRLGTAIAAASCTLVLGVAFCTPVLAQGPGGGRGGFGGGGGFGMSEAQLAQIPQVQKELELVDDQVAKLKELGGGRGQGGGRGEGTQEERRERRATAQKEQKAKIDAILLPQQQARLAEIALQVRGTGALNDAEVQSKLGITDAQKAQLTTISEENRKAMSELFGGGGRGQGGGDRDANREKMTKARAEANEKTLAVLTSDQKAAFEKLQGKKFELDRSALGGGQGGGRRQRRGAAAN